MPSTAVSCPVGDQGHLRQLIPVARQALTEAGTSMSEISAVAAHRGPGLPAIVAPGHFRRRPGFRPVCRLYGIHHHEAHLIPVDFQAALNGVGLTFRRMCRWVVVGGHTMLVSVEGELRHRVLGGTPRRWRASVLTRPPNCWGFPIQVDRGSIDWQRGIPQRSHFPPVAHREANPRFQFQRIEDQRAILSGPSSGVGGRPARFATFARESRGAIVEVPGFQDRPRRKSIRRRPA